MKNAILLLALLFAGTALRAQDTLRQLFPPALGDVIPLHVDTILNQIGPGAAGPNQVWDFTGAGVSFEDTNFIWRDPSQLPGGNLYPNANLAYTEEGTEAQVFFRETADTTFIEGVADNFFSTGDTFPIFYDAPAFVYAYPFTFPDVQVQTQRRVLPPIPYPGGSAVFDSARGTGTISVTDSVDGWGEILLPCSDPNDTTGLKVLRVHRITSTIDSIFGQVGGSWTLINVDLYADESYHWESETYGELAEMLLDTLGGDPLELRYFFDVSRCIVGRGETLDLRANFSLFPNPGKGRVYLEGSVSPYSPTFISVLSADGRVLGEWEQTGPEISLSLDSEELGLSSGIYLVRVRTAEGIAALKWVVPR